MTETISLQATMSPEAAEVPAAPGPGPPKCPAPVAVTTDTVSEDVHQTVATALSDRFGQIRGWASWGAQVHLIVATVGLLGLPYTLIAAGHENLITPDFMVGIEAAVVLLAAVHVGARTLDLRQLGSQLASILPWNRKP